MTEKQEVKEDLTEKFAICPCCGKPTLNLPVQPDKQLVDHWLCCMVAGEPFKHTYSLYGGKIELVISSLSVDDDTTLGLLSNMLDAIGENKELMGKLSINVSQLKAMSRICMSIHKIIIHAGGDTKTYVPHEVPMHVLEELKAKYADIMTGTLTTDLIEHIGKCVSLLTTTTAVSALPLDVLLTAVETHNQLNSILMGSGFDENFWSGIKLG